MEAQEHLDLMEAQDLRDLQEQVEQTDLQVLQEALVLQGSLLTIKVIGLVVLHIK
jgi:hypothetical protein